MSDFKPIYTSVVPQVTEARLYDETIEKVRLGHPEVPIELPCMQTASESAITNPTTVEFSQPSTYIFVDHRSTNKAGDPLAVPVKVVAGGTSGRVKSIYFAERPRSANVVWKRDGDV